MMDEVWTEQRVAELRRLVEEEPQLSTAQIGARLDGISRSAVIGKLNRLGIKKPAPQYRQSHRGAQAEVAAVDVPSCARLDAPQPSIPSMRPVSLMGLEPHHCRFPLGAEAPFRFCGDQRIAIAGPYGKTQSPYCAHHTKLCMPGRGV